MRQTGYFTIEDSVKRIRNILSEKRGAPGERLPSISEVQEGKDIEGYAIVMYVRYKPKAAENRPKPEITDEDLDKNPALYSALSEYESKIRDERKKRENARKAFITEALRLVSSKYEMFRDYMLIEDGIIFIMEAALKTNVDASIEMAAKLNSLSHIISRADGSIGSPDIKIGIDLGRVNCSRIGFDGDLRAIWYGEAVENASHTSEDKFLTLTSDVLSNTSKSYYSYFDKEEDGRYTGNIVCTNMENWAETYM